MCVSCSFIVAVSVDLHKGFRYPETTTLIEQAHPSRVRINYWGSIQHGAILCHALSSPCGSRGGLSKDNGKNIDDPESSRFKDYHPKSDVNI